MERKQVAIDNFLKGYNCCQSIVLAFKDLVDIDEKSLAKLASGFGGGMGRLRETCGAVSGVFMIIGLLYGYESPETGEIKAKLYAKIQELGLQFEKEQGSLVCRELLGINEKHSSSTPSSRTSSFYKDRPCIKYIGFASELLEEYIDKHKQDNK